MKESRPILKLKLPIKKEVLISKFPLGVIVEKKKEVKKVEAKLLVPKPPKAVSKTPKAIKKTKPKYKVINKKEVVTKPALVTYKLYAKMLAYFKNKYPKCFVTPAMPIAIGIHKQMFEDEIELGVSRKQIRIFCAIYCAKPEYKESLKVGVPRLDLLGNVTNSVTEEELPPIKSL
jgi:hypothetical protein